MLKKLVLAVALAAAAFGVSGCTEDDAQVVSRNLSKAADNFEVMRRVVFYNGITGDYMLEITGLCSQDPLNGRIAVTCKTGPNEYKKHFLGLSDNVTYFSEQVEGVGVSKYFYRVTFKPTTILPDIRLSVPGK